MKKFINSITKFKTVIIISLFTILNSINLMADINIPKIKINTILEASITSSINPATLNYLKTAYTQSKKIDADLILIKINTPGGLVTTTKDIIRLFGESNIPTLVWVTPEGSSATSAGAIIASAAHILVMSEGTNIGAATPVELGKDVGKKDLRKKSINDLVALVQSLSEARNRNSKLFGEMVEKASSFKAREAVKKNLINGIANNYDDIYKILKKSTINIKGSPVKFIVDSPKIVHLEMDLGQKLLNIFANPNMAYILFLIGAALMYLELQTPGGFIAGSIGLMALILAAISFQVLPLNLGGLGLIILAFFLFVLEIYIISYGILSLAGLCALTFGSLFLFRTDNAYIELSTSLIISAIGGIVAFMGFITLYWMYDAKKLKQHSFFNLRGMTGEVIGISNNPPEDYFDGSNLFEYQVKVSGEIWRAKSSYSFKLNDKCTIDDRFVDELILKISKK